MTYAAQLKTMRQARGLTQEELAAKTGIPNTYLSMMETGRIIPAGEWEAKLREALEWTPDTDALLGELLQHTSLDVTAHHLAA
ncbi:MAG: helix-turn-helix transcriptional regulator [Anaerolineae bacterium]|jgi:transcriptional regulator with XRE-family HTH domain|nr:helix-turn-helix transcriptional regulator [Anaerolineae bacterium]